MHPGTFAETAADRAAIIMGGSGEVVSFAALDARANQLAHVFRQRGLQPGTAMAIVAENHPRFLEVAWAAHRSGLRYTAVNSHLTVDEAAYIIDDCGAAAVIATEAAADVAHAATEAAGSRRVATRLLVGADRPGWEPYETVVAAQPTGPIADPGSGVFMLYSSGTTGRPKGVERPLTLSPLDDEPQPAAPLLQALGFEEGHVYLCPAPLYHAAPLAWSMAAHGLGGTVVVMERFDAAACLEAIERYRVTHGQFVPTMFVRMLKLPASVRGTFDLTSLRGVVHAAAPCPVEVKRQMIDWWGPILYEYYSATEGMGVTFIDSQDWLAHPGSVGRPVVGEPHIRDDAGNELPPGEIGTVWFSGGYEFQYHGDPDKTAAATSTDGLTTVGDVGYLDDEGYLYLTDRQAFTIISGGVNIYPREIEDVLITDPRVLDVGVIGVPDPDMGESVVAVVQPVDWADAGPDLADDLRTACRERLAGYKCPRRVEFLAELPRLDTGKLYKHRLRELFAG